MITAPKTPAPAPEFWGKVKGMVRHIAVHSKGEYAVYVIEESPGYREIRFNRRKYRIFFPWLYFFVKVLKTCETSDKKLYVFVSRTQMKDANDPCMLLAPFPSSIGSGAICMPDGNNKAERPIYTALDVIVEFWKSNSTELNNDGKSLVPDQLLKGKPFDKIGTIYGNWSRLAPVQAMNLEFDEPTSNTVNGLLVKMGHQIKRG